jgi:hypothetical protein
VQLLVAGLAELGDLDVGVRQRSIPRVEELQGTGCDKVAVPDLEDLSNPKS